MRFEFPTSLLLLSAGLCLAMSWATAALGEGLQKGERVVFLGDSITQAGAGPGGYVTLVREALEKDHKELGVEVIGAGISGNKVPDLEARLDRDVISKKPARVVIYIGINDVWHSQTGKGTPKDKFEAGLKSIIQRIKDAGAQVILCTASVIGEKTDSGNKLDKMLDEFCDVSRAVAQETKTPLLDLRKAFLDHLKQHNAKNEVQGILTTDGVHLNAAGNQFVAGQMLAALLGGGKSSSSLRHVVLFKFKESVSAPQVQEIIDAFRALPSKIEAIQGFEWGTDVGVENLAQGFTHCFIVTFADEKGRDAYLPHPAHEDFKKLVGGKIDKVLVVDFWTKK